MHSIERKELIIMPLLRKNLDKILGTFTRTLSDLEVLIKQREDENDVLEQSIITAENMKESNLAEIIRASKVKANIERIFE